MTKIENWEEVDKRFDIKFPEGYLGHKHLESCEFSCILRDELHEFLHSELKLQAKEIIEEINGELQYLFNYLNEKN